MCCDTLKNLCPKALMPIQGVALRTIATPTLPIFPGFQLSLALFLIIFSVLLPAVMTSILSTDPADQECSDFS